MRNEAIHGSEMCSFYLWSLIDFLVLTWFNIKSVFLVIYLALYPVIGFRRLDKNHIGGAA